MGARSCCSRKNDTKKKHNSVTEFIMNKQGGLSKSMTIKQRHENTKDKLNQLVVKARDSPELSNITKQESYKKSLEAQENITSDHIEELLSKSLELHQKREKSPLLTPTLEPGKKVHKARGSYSYSKSNDKAIRHGELDSQFIKRNSQTYHSFFKDNEGFKRSKTKNSRFSKRSRKSKRLSNPFKPASSILVSSSSSSSLSQVEGFHLVGELANTVNYRTEKAVNLKNGKPIIIKYFKISDESKLEKLGFFKELLKDFQAMPKCQFLVKVKDFRLDEDTGKLVMIQQHCKKLMDLEYFLGNYQKQYLKKKNSKLSDNSPYIEPSRVKIITFQIIQALKALAGVERNHGKLDLSNIFVSKKYKIKISDYCIHHDPLGISFIDGQILDLFNLGICILKMLGLAALQEKFDFYMHDKKDLRNHYKHVKDWKLRSFLDILLIKKNCDLDLADLQPFLQINDNDLESMSKISLDESTDSDSIISNSVKCDFTFRSQSDNSETEKATESDKVDPNLQKFLTNTSESTSLNYKVEEIPASLMPSGTELPPINAKKKIYKPISAKDERSIHHGFGITGTSSDENEDSLPSSNSESQDEIAGGLLNDNKGNNIINNTQLPWSQNWKTLQRCFQQRICKRTSEAG
ncbi:unnamed protein product [Moneuplotes crassus]|uniref:Protein kinase domain-containing protein n=1 Tax=Euplotes crassus TaxID=5936 RepID=A0AAD1TYT5_EUPCR|nr:unnamed protein product [Moneuplotes crassus]